MSKGCAVVTGYSQKGLAEAIAAQLASEGYDIVVGYFMEPEVAEAFAKELEETHGVKAYAVYGDLRKYEDCKKLIEFAVEKTGGIQVLTNCAGIFKTAMFHELTPTEIDNIIQTDLMHALYCTHEAVPYMIEQKFGRIINLSSHNAIDGIALHVTYGAAKGGLISMTKSLAKELGPHNITVNAVAPGMIWTGMLKDARPEDVKALEDNTPLRMIGEPKDISDAVSYIVNARYLTGQVISPNGGVTM